MSITRRYFLGLLAFVGAATHELIAAAPSRIKIGCQTNAWRIDPRDFSQFLNVLSVLKDLKFAGFETGFRNVQGQFANATQARQQIEKIGLTFFGTHIFLEKYDAQTQIAPIELITQVVDGAAQLGAEQVILSGGGLAKDGVLDNAALKRKVDGLNAAGKYAKSKGVSVSYHNHAPEFALSGAEIEGLLRYTDPELVEFVLDCGHAFRAKVDTAQFFARHFHRLSGLHLRDFRSNTQVPLGKGDFNLTALAAVVNQTKWEGWVLNEEERADGSKPGESAVAPAREALRRTFGS